MIVEPRLGKEITEAIEVCVNFCNVMQEEVVLNFNGKNIPIGKNTTKSEALAIWSNP